MADLISVEVITSKILFLRWKKVMLDTDLALLYGVRTKRLNEQGVAMLSGILNSDRAILVNIQIMRAFIQLKRMLLTNVDLRHKIEKMEKKYDKQFAIVFQTIRQLLESPPVKPKPPIGFRSYDKKD